MIKQPTRLASVYRLPTE